jgi:N-methylhydantoinase A
MRYAGQGGELTVPWPATLDAARIAFAEAHRQLNGFVLESRVELVTLRVEAEGLVAAPIRSVLPPGTGASPTGRQEVWFGDGDAVLAGVYPREALGVGDRIVGPAIVTQLDATTLVPPGWSAEVATSGALLLTREA